MVREDIRSIPRRIIAYYVGPIDKASISYWQRLVFYVISLTGIVAGSLCLVPTVAIVVHDGHLLAAALLVLVYAVNVAVILAPGIPITAKTLVIAIDFYLFGLASLVLAGPEGESGIWFSVCVLLCSLFVGPGPAVSFACLDLITGIGFGVLHSRGLIGWEVLSGFSFLSWLVQSGNIFFIDMLFVAANTIFIRGVGRTFGSLNEAQAQIGSALAEKETLIRELYHRSKNNMQVISSLLVLHSRELPSNEAKSVFRDVISKIGAMSLVHQKLYESRDLSKVNIAEYIRDLVALLRRSYGVPPQKVAIEMELEDSTMLIDSAIPCGLVVSEIIANSFKHAFPGDRRGWIRLGLRNIDEATVELYVADNGIGLPDGFEPGKHGRMGMRTLYTVVRHQLQGSIELGLQGGLSFTISFKRRLYDERVGGNA